MNAYLASVLESVKTKHGNEPEFVQTVEEVLSSLEPVIEKHPEYEKVDLLNRMVAPVKEKASAASRSIMLSNAALAADIAVELAEMRLG